MLRGYTQVAGERERRAVNLARRAEFLRQAIFVAFSHALEYEAAPAARIAGTESLAGAILSSPAVGEYYRAAGFSGTERTGFWLFRIISLIIFGIYIKASAAYARRPIILFAFIVSGILPAAGYDRAAAYRYIAAVARPAAADARAAPGAVGRHRAASYRYIATVSVYTATAAADARAASAVGHDRAARYTYLADSVEAAAANARATVSAIGGDCTTRYRYLAAGIMGALACADARAANGAD